MHFLKWFRYKDWKPLAECKIHSRNLMYARHPPKHWKEEENFPDVTQIRSTQSFYWSAFSIPFWARFNDKNEYKENHGVCGYSVFTIRNAHVFNKTLPENAYGLKHAPTQTRYSHCELYPIRIGKRNQKLKNAYRHALKNNATVKIEPYAKVSRCTNLLEKFNMIKHFIFMVFSK